MRRLELWADEPDRTPLCLDSRVMSLEPYRRNSLESARRAAYDDGTIVGFFLGVAAAVLAWLILSGLLLRLAVAIVHGVVWLVAGRLP
ncbi:MAG TPA: hypothetical protein VN903_00870 [Polyangia bacterium]|nr:hypothetical protein [Gemmatimonadales bacterium]HXT99510.1 hypothetical protein [Polyangia bacterium]